MNYELTIYGPLEELHYIDTMLKLGAVFPATGEQLRTVWETMKDYPDFNSVSIHRKCSGDLVIHVYDEPIDVPEHSSCVFHSKIAPSGTYA
jgi:hypothetical protein